MPTPFAYGATSSYPLPFTAGMASSLPARARALFDTDDDGDLSSKPGLGKPVSRPKMRSALPTSSKPSSASPTPPSKAQGDEDDDDDDDDDYMSMVIAEPTSTETSFHRRQRLKREVSSSLPSNSP